MFKVFSKKRLVDYFCLINIEQIKLSKEFIESCIAYLNDKKFTISHFFSGTDNNKYEKGPLSELYKVNFSDLAYLCVYNNDAHEKASIKVNWILGPPNFIYIELDETFLFDFKEFVMFAKKYFRIDYGYVYKGTGGERTESYLFGQRENVKYLKDISRIKEVDYEIWQKNRFKINDGKIRDVYRLNLLNSAQVFNRCRNDGTLYDLIMSNQKFGMIEEVYENHFYWQVETAFLEKVRYLLKDEEFLS